MFGVSKTSDCKSTNVHSGEEIHTATPTWAHTGKLCTARSIAGKETVRRDKISHPKIDGLVLPGAKEGKCNTVF